MTFSYFPGCTLKTQGKDLDTYGRKAAAALGIDLQELPEWQCCGAVYPQAKDEIATRLSSVRALANARDLGNDLVTLCSACHHVIKRVNGDIKNDETIRTRVQNYLQLEQAYEGETNVLHYLEVLRDKIGFDELAKKVVNPLTGRKIGAYYGCLLLRPGKELGFDDPENPTIIEDFIRALGAEPVYYGMRNECCGGYTVVEGKTYAQKQVAKIMDNAKNSGAEELITACPLCMYNLRKNADNGLPVYYFTELLAEALGVKEAEV
ncbi:MAG: CoB--CoM heterodisulfide reductase iron-sulfur subunit B family protein [Oscillospiraceae bacterium]|nr:CoB--CoM heterodisulfide reductase iron-sulfur subunit B family protein [Oscillospiraceae bacterium]